MFILITPETVAVWVAGKLVNTVFNRGWKWLKRKLSKNNKERLKNDLQIFESHLETLKWRKETIDDYEYFIFEVDSLYQIKIGEYEEDEFYEDWLKRFPAAHESKKQKIHLKHNNVPIKELYFVSADGHKYFVPMPEPQTIANDHQYYYVQNSLEYKLAKVIGRFTDFNNLENFAKFCGVYVVKSSPEEIKSIKLSSFIELINSPPLLKTGREYDANTKTATLCIKLQMTLFNTGNKPIVFNSSLLTIKKNDFLKNDTTLGLVSYTDIKDKSPSKPIKNQFVAIEKDTNYLTLYYKYSTQNEELVKKLQGDNFTYNVSFLYNKEEILSFKDLVRR